MGVVGKSLSSIFRVDSPSVRRVDWCRRWLRWEFVADGKQLNIIEFALHGHEITSKILLKILEDQL